MRSDHRQAYLSGCLAKDTLTWIHTQITWDWNMSNLTYLLLAAWSWTYPLDFSLIKTRVGSQTAVTWWNTSTWYQWLFIRISLSHASHGVMSTYLIVKYFVLILRTQNTSDTTLTHYLKRFWHNDFLCQYLIFMCWGRKGQPHIRWGGLSLVWDFYNHDKETNDFTIYGQWESYQVPRYLGSPLR